MIFHIDHGQYGNTTLDDLNFALIAHTPDIMGKGDWSVGLITDERATQEQQQALTAIASGQAGGPQQLLAHSSASSWGQSRSRFTTRRTA